MKEIPLTPGIFGSLVALIDDCDFERVSVHKWCAVNGKHTFYAATWINGKQVIMHRFILGLTDPEIGTDHIDGNGLHNYRSNIRAASRSINQFNTQKHRTALRRFKGVTWHKKAKKWQTQTHFNKRRIYIGCFDSEVEAAQAYDSKIVELLGKEQANLGRVLNFAKEA